MQTERFRICWQRSDLEPEPHCGVWFGGSRAAAEAIVAEQNRSARHVEYWLECMSEKSSHAIERRDRLTQIRGYLNDPTEATPSLEG